MPTTTPDLPRSRVAGRTGRHTLAGRLGLPDTAGQRPLLGAHLVDSLGSGLILTFTVVYFVRTTSLTLTAVGAAISLGRLLALPTAVLTGPVLDRYGARAVATAANLLSALGYAGFLLAHRSWQIVAVILLAQIGHAAYWTSSTGLVVLAADETRRTRWFALVSTLRNAGLALGGALGALLLAVGGTTGLRATALLNAASFLTAAALLATWRPAHPPARTAPAGTPAPGSYRTVLSDRRYLLLVTVNLANVFATLVLSLLLAVYLTDGLHQQAWVAGSLLVLNSAQVVLTQTAVTRRLERFRPTRVIAAAHGLNAIAFGLFAALSAAPGWAVLAGLYAAMVVYNTAETMATPFAENLSVHLAHPAMRGRYLAVYQLSWTLGQVTAPALLTLLLGHGAVLPWLFLAATALAAIPALVLLERTAGPQDRTALTPPAP
ncbi:MFS transporter [Kitasatospora sp. NPDC085879]|uniref:MFS transporter n=1 Tax=Kitasatospora sp. NPDC085879 TaxID=3154769 RepID=UPI0034354D5D